MSQVLFSKILVGTDGSETSMAAVEKAAALAQMSRAELIILYAVRTPSSVADVGGAAAVPDPQILVEEGEELLAEAESQVPDGVRARTLLRRGDPARTIVETAAREAADLIVVGNRGMRGARRLLGSVPNAVAHQAPCDVLIAHTG